MISKKIFCTLLLTTIVQAAQVVKADEVQPGTAGLARPNLVRDLTSSDAEGLDFTAKRKACVDLIERGINYLANNTEDQAFNVFSHSRDFIVGELYIFVFDLQGVCMAHGQQANFIWQNLWEMRDSYGSPIIQNIIKKALEGGGWMTYEWRKATKVSYVKKVEKDGKVYAIGTGYYPHSKEDSVIGLVKGATALFKRTIEEGGSAENVFALLSYPQGQFVLGDLYLYALDFEGMLVAQGDRPGLIGTSAWDAADAQGKKINQEIIQKLKETSGGVWVKYISKKAEKHSYAEKVTDKQGNNYFIACGYYPDADRAQAIDLVRQGFRYMKANGLSSSAEAISDKRNDQFRYGDLYLEVYTLKGKCIAHGNNQDLVGKDFWDTPDQAGKLYMQDLVKRAQDGSGWVDYKLRNLFKSNYVEKIDLGTDSYIITCGLYPISKRESTILLVKTAADYLKSVPRHDAFREFVSNEGKFVRGDLSVFSFDFGGLCFAYGDDHNLIWKNLINLKDEDGKAFVRLFINTVKSGPGQVSFRLNSARKLAYVEAVEKDGKSYVVGSSYYL